MLTSDPIRQTARSLRLVPSSSDESSAPVIDFELIVEESLSLVVFMDAEGVVLYVNRRFCEVTGYTPEEVVGRRIHELGELPPEQAAEIWSTVSAGEPWRGEFAGRKKGGEEYWVYSCIAPISSPEGEVTNYLAVNLDITERKAAEDELRRSESRFRAVTESIYDVVSAVDSSGTIAYQSPSVERILGYTVEERIGKSTFDFVHPEDEEEARKAFAELIGKSDEVRELRLRARHKDGSWRVLESIARARINADGSPRVIVASRDVTERVLVEESLRESEATKAALLKAIPDMMFRLGRDGRAREFIPAQGLEPMMPVEEFLGKNVLAMIPREIAEQSLEAVARALETGETQTFEYWLPEPRGGWFEARVVRSGTDEVLALVRDISERKGAEEALRTSQERLRSIVENVSDTILAINQDGMIQYESPSVARVLGYAPGALTGTQVFDLVHPDDQIKAYELSMKGLSQPGVVQTGEFRVRHADGRWLLMEAVGHVVPDGDGGSVGYLASRDITDRKRAEEALRASEDYFRSLTENSSDVIDVIDSEGKILFESKAIETVLGYGPDQQVGSNVLSALHPEDLPRAAEILGQAFAEPGSVQTAELRVRHKDGSWRYVGSVAKVQPGLSGEPVAVVNSRDVTERREAENALREAQERLQFALDQGEMSAWDWDIEKDAILDSAGTGGPLGAEDGSPVTYDGFLERVHPDDRERVQEAVRRALEEGAEYRPEFRMRFPDGGVRWVMTSGAVVFAEDGKPARLSGVAVDITERRVAEDTLRASEARLRMALEGAQMMTWEWDVREDAGTFLTGEGPGALLLGNSYDEFLSSVVEEDRQRVAEAVQRSLDAGVPYREELRVAPPGGPVRWIAAQASAIRSQDGTSLRFVGVAMDITERKKGEAALVESEERFRSLIEDGSDVMAIMENDGVVRYVSPSATRVLGYELADIVGVNGLNLVHPEDMPAVMESFTRTVAGPNQDLAIRFRMRSAAGDWLMVESMSRPLADGTGIVVNLRDITEREQAEAALRESEERYRALYRDNPSMYFTVAEDGTVLSVNQFGAEQLRYAVDELVGHSVFDIFHRSDRAIVRRHLLALSGNPGEVGTWEVRKVRKDGEVIWVKETARAVRDADRRTTFLVVCEDISERKHMEIAMEALREQLERRAERAVARGNTFGLSFRELTVLDLVAGGKSDKEIAVVLGIRPMTVSKHVANVLKKMGAASRAEAGVRAWREGLIR